MTLFCFCGKLASSQIRNLQGVSTETFMGRRDKWPKTVLDEPKIENCNVYSGREK